MEIMACDDMQGVYEDITDAALCTAMGYYWNEDLYINYCCSFTLDSTTKKEGEERFNDDIKK